MVGAPSAHGKAEEWQNPDQEMTDELTELLDSVFLDLVPIAHG